MEERPKFHPATLIILVGLAIGVALFIASPYLFGRFTSDTTIRTVLYILLSFPLPVMIFSFLSGFRYGKDAKSKVLEDLLISVICISVVFLYAIIQASPGELAVVILKGIIFLIFLFGSVYGLARIGFQFGINKNRT